MIVRLDIAEVTKALGAEAIRKMGGSGDYRVELKSIELSKREGDEPVRELWVEMEIVMK